MTVDIKKAQERLNALYKEYDYTDKKHDDKKILHGEMLSYLHKERYASMSDEDRNELNKSIRKGWESKQGTLPLETMKQLMEDIWTCPRDDEDYLRISKKYNKSIDYLKCMELDQYYHPNLDKLKSNWIKKYGVSYEVISPGNDMLDYYDEQNELRSESMKLLLPPSIIFHYRFRETDWKPKDVKAKFPHIKGNTLLPMLRIRMDWLVDKPSQKIITQDLIEAEKFYTKITGKKATSGIRRLAHEGVMGWQGDIGGWTVNHLGGKKFK